MFIVFEGNDGSGKSTIIKHIYKRLENNNYKTFVTYEPGEKKINVTSIIRKEILNNSYDYITELLLYMIDRNEHIKQIIIPKLNNNNIVICDRFYYSSTIYQGYLNRNNSNDNFWLKILSINKQIFSNCSPDLIFFIVSDPKIAIKRINNRQISKNKYDMMTLNKHMKIYEGYKELYLYCKNQKEKNIFLIENNDKILPNIDKIYKIILSKIKKNENSRNI